MECKHGIDNSVCWMCYNDGYNKALKDIQDRIDEYKEKGYEDRIIFENIKAYIKFDKLKSKHKEV